MWIAVLALTGAGVASAVWSGFDPIASLLVAIGCGIFGFAAGSRMVLVYSMYRMHVGFHERDVDLLERELPDLFDDATRPREGLLVCEMSRRIQAPGRAATLAHWRGQRAFLLLEQERYDEALAELEDIDVSPLTESEQIWLESIRAWGLAHNGRSEEAIALAGSLLERDQKNGGY